MKILLLSFVLLKYPALPQSMLSRQLRWTARSCSNILLVMNRNEATVSKDLCEGGGDRKGGQLCWEVQLSLCVNK